MEDPLPIETPDTEEQKVNKPSEPDTKGSDDDINVLSGPNDVDVAIRPDVKENRILIQFCSCSILFSCFNR